MLRWRSYGESDKIVTFLTESFGKLTGIAKGAKRSRRRFVNSLESLAQVRLHFRMRPGASLAFLESAELLQPLGALADPVRLAYAGYLAELTEQMTAEEQPVCDIYALLEEALAALQQGPASAGLVRGFELQLLARSGLEPGIEHCSACERPSISSPRAFFDPAAGAFHCIECRAPGGAYVDVPSALLERLLPLKRLPLAECRTYSLGPHTGEAAQLMTRLLALHLSRPLQSVKVIAQVTADRST